VCRSVSWLTLVSKDTVVVRINDTLGKYDQKWLYKKKSVLFILLIFHSKNVQKSNL